jgi:hypothetical protein
VNELKERGMPIDFVEMALESLQAGDHLRQQRYARNWRYYTNNPYPEGRPGIYARMRGIFNQVTQIVDTDARFLMGEKLQVKARPAVEAAINQLWETSDFQQDKYLLARYGACCGDAFIKVVDNRAWELNPQPDAAVPMKLLVMPPEAVTPRYHPHDRQRMLACKIEYVMGTPANSRLGREVHKEVWTEREVLLYDPRQPRRVKARYPNPHGFIPVVHIRNLDIGEEFGLSSFHHLLPTVDAINEVASFLLDIIKLYGDPVIIGKGMEKGSLRKQTVDQHGRPVATVWWIPNPEAGFEMLEWKGNLPEMLEYISKIEDSLRRAAPELILAGLPDRKDVSGYALSLHLSELQKKVSEMRGNYFAGIEKANRMALRMMAAEETANSNGKHEIVANPILPADDLTQLKALQIENQVLRIKSRATVAAERGIPDVEEELAKVKEEGETEEHINYVR